MRPMVFWTSIVPAKKSTLCHNALGRSVVNGALVNSVSKFASPANAPRVVPRHSKNA